MFDEIYNLHLINNEMEWIKKVDTLPELRCIMYDNEMVKEVENLLKYSNTPVMFVYDTTFNLCKYFVSPLLCKFTFFFQEPVIPLAFLMHEKKTENCHNQFFRKISQIVPLLKDKNKAFFATDHEDAFRNAIKSNFPHSVVLRCWNHLFKNIRDWIKKHNGKKLDSKVYCSDCRELFKCDSKDSYKILLSKKQAYWDSAFNKYYLTHIHPDINLIAK